MKRGAVGSSARGPSDPRGPDWVTMRQALSSSTPRSFSRGSEKPQRVQVPQPRAHARVLLPDSASDPASNVPSAPGPSDVSRHAFCPPSSLRPNAPFQLLRTGGWRRAPRGCAHRPAHSAPRVLATVSGLLAETQSGHPRVPTVSPPCPHRVPPVPSLLVPDRWWFSCQLLFLSFTPLQLLKFDMLEYEQLRGPRLRAVALCWKIREVESRVESNSGRTQTPDPAHFVEVV